MKTRAHTTRIHSIQLARPMCTTEKSVTDAEKNACNIRVGWMRGGGRKRNKPLYLRLKCSQNIVSLQNGLNLPNGVIRVMIFPLGGGRYDNLPG